MRGRQLVGINVKRLRISAGVAQERLAFDSGVDRSYVGGVERGEENPTVDILDRLAATLGVPIRDLFAEHDPTLALPSSLKRGRKPKSDQA